MSQFLQNNAIKVKEIARAIGFDHCGIAKAVRLDDDAKRLEQWLNKGFHGEMKYMENHFDMRVDPTKLVPGAKSAKVETAFAKRRRVFGPAITRGFL